MKLSIIIPAYNEAATIAEVIRRVQAIPLPCDREIIVVDDGSTDGTGDLARRMYPDILLTVEHGGKGAAIKEALWMIEMGDYVCILDADLEYAPEDIPKLLAHNGIAISGVREGRSLANRILSYLYGQQDICSGLKIIHAATLRALNLTETGFGFECELTRELRARRIPIVEVPISYYPRTRAEGKKMTLWHALRCAWCLL